MYDFKATIFRLLGIFVCFYVSSLQAADEVLDEVINKQTKVNQKALLAQQKINHLSDETRELIEEYKQVILQTENFNAYNKHLEKMISSQKSEEISLNKQLSSIDLTAEGIIPLMLKMTDALDKYIELDVPFLLSERRERISKIKKMMSKAGISTSEKYRRVLEAYQVEMDYGRTLETYTGKLTSENSERSVNFIRFGRLILLYQTLDQSEAGVWDSKNKSWKLLKGDYKREITKAINIAKKQQVPDLLVLPVKSPEVMR